MRVMVLVKANNDTEAGVLPTTAELTAMGAYNEELVNAGVMQAGEGMKASSHGVRVRFGDDGLSVLDGPFTPAEELVAGYWIWQVDSLDDAVAWARRAPFPPGNVLELRPVFEAADFGEALTPELQDREQTLRDRTQR